MPRLSSSGTLASATMLALLLVTGCGQSGSDNSTPLLATASVATASVATASAQNAGPVLLDYPVAFVRRSLTLNNDGDVVSGTPRELNVFSPGAGLFIKDRAVSSADERNITDRAFLGPEDDANQDMPAYDVRDLEVDYDGQRLVFSMRGPFDPDPLPQLVMASRTTSPSRTPRRATADEPRSGTRVVLCSGTPVQRTAVRTDIKWWRRRESAWSGQPTLQSTLSPGDLDLSVRGIGEERGRSGWTRDS